MIEAQLQSMKDRIKFLPSAIAKAKQNAEALGKEEIFSSPEEKKPPAKKRKVSTSSSKSKSSTGKRAPVPKKSNTDKSSTGKRAGNPKKKKTTIEIDGSSDDDNSDLEATPLTKKRTGPTNRPADSDIESISSSGSSSSDDDSD